MAKNEWKITSTKGAHEGTLDAVLAWHKGAQGQAARLWRDGRECLVDVSFWMWTRPVPRQIAYVRRVMVPGSLNRPMDSAEGFAIYDALRGYAWNCSQPEIADNLLKEATMLPGQTLHTLQDVVDAVASDVSQREGVDRTRAAMVKAIVKVLNASARQADTRSGPGPLQTL
jgi:hypothetical protein